MPPIKFNIIETNRLLLREMTPEVYQQAFFSYSDDELKQFYALKTDEELQNKKSQYKNGLTMFNKSFLYFQLLEKESNAVIGWCGYHTLYTQHSRAEIGYGLFGDEYKNKGYMKEALAPIIAYGFEKMNLHRIEAFVGPDNEPSLKLVRGFGFVEEGRLREHYNHKGRMEDSVVFGLLKKNLKD